MASVGAITSSNSRAQCAERFVLVTDALAQGTELRCERIPPGTRIDAKAACGGGQAVPTTAQTGSVSRAQASPLRHGDADEHYHLPEDVHTEIGLGSVMEETTLRDLEFSISRICGWNRDGSYKTQADRQRILRLAARQMHGLGFQLKSATSLKPKHVEALLLCWKDTGLSAGSLKNRMSALRWLAEKIGKPAIIARSNDTYGIDDRQYVTNVSKARELTEEDLAKLTCEMTCMSLRLQDAFGLRREESIKIQPAVADKGDRLQLMPSWTKGGRARWIRIRTPEQRQLLDEAKALASRTRLGSLIERETYREQLHAFTYQCRKAGIHHVHGHRHLYAQRRYLAITGWPCPAAGGPTSKELTPLQKQLDETARVVISRELGHGREQIVAVYVGR